MSEPITEVAFSFSFYNSIIYPISSSAIFFYYIYIFLSLSGLQKQIEEHALSSNILPFFLIHSSMTIFGVVLILALYVSKFSFWPFMFDFVFMFDMYYLNRHGWCVEGFLLKALQF